jgi:hypothetical protein
VRPSLAKIERLKAEAEDETQAICGRHYVPQDEDVPEDLRDEHGAMIQTSTGHAVAGRITANDVSLGWRSPGASLWQLVNYHLICLAPLWVTATIWPILAIMPTVAKVYAVFMAGLVILTLIVFARRAESGTKEILLVVAWYAILALFASQVLQFGLNLDMVDFAAFASMVFVGAFWIAAYCERSLRFRELVLAGGHGTPPKLASEDARAVQIENAKRDDTHVLHLGKAMGHVFQYTKDPLAPDPGKAMSLSVKDLLQHVLVLGGTGSGKTSGIFRPLAKQWIENNCGGMLVLCGKGQLPQDFVGLSNYVLVHPETSQINLVEGLKAEDVAEVLKQVVFDPANQGDQIWSQHGRELVRHAGMLVEGIHSRNPQQAPWTLETLYKTMVDEEFRKELLQIVENSGENEVTDLEVDAHAWFVREFNPKYQEFQESVLGTIQGWFSDLMGHREFRTWTRCESGEDVTQCLRGKLVGVSTPGFEFGQAGSTISAFLRFRVYTQAQKRRDSWAASEGETPCLILMDEAHELLAGMDEHMAAKARSLGLGLVVGTQNIPQLFKRFQKYGGSALINLFMSVICLRADHETYEWLVKRIGPAPKLITNPRQHAVNYEATNKMLATAPIWDRSHLHSQRMRRAKREPALTKITTLGAKLLGKQKDKGKGKEDDPNVEGVFNLVSDKPLIEDFQVNALLNRPFLALATLNRGNVARRDFMELDPVFGFKS